MSVRPRPRAAAFPLGLAALLLALAGCGGTTQPGGDGPAEPITELPRELTAAEQELIRSSNAFGFDLLEEVAAGSDDPNLFLSPLSASMAVGMTLNGAEGETHEGIRTALRLGNVSLEEVNDSYLALIELLRGLDPDVRFRLANAVFLAPSYPILDAFRTRVEESFDARVANMDFRDAATAEEINDWIEERTEGRIQDFVSPGQIRDLVALLANAIYFEGSWTEQFDPDDTAEGEFRRRDGSTASVPFMRRTLEAGLLERAGEYRALDLPYGGEAYSMTVVLPPEGETVEELTARLDAETWESLTEGLAETEVMVALPRFELRDEHRLGDALRAMGMDAAFDPERADFSGLSDRALEDELHVQFVKQKTFLKVDEEGTEAAAATGVGIGPTSAPPAFRADRPFLLAIRERLSGTILFLGTIGDPSAA